MKDTAFSNYFRPTYVPITSSGLEKYEGFPAAMFLNRHNRDNRSYTLGVIDFDDNNEPCLVDNSTNERIALLHGDSIRLKVSEKRPIKGKPWIRHYVFIDQSD